MSALERMVLITDPDTNVLSYLLPWFIRAIQPTGDGTSEVITADHDVWAADEPAEVIAQRILDCQMPAEEMPA